MCATHVNYIYGYMYKYIIYIYFCVYDTVDYSCRFEGARASRQNSFAYIHRAVYVYIYIYKCIVRGMK